MKKKVRGLPGDYLETYLLASLLSSHDWNLRFLGGGYEDSKFSRKFEQESEIEKSPISHSVLLGSNRPIGRKLQEGRKKVRPSWSPGTSSSPSLASFRQLQALGVDREPPRTPVEDSPRGSPLSTTCEASRQCPRDT